MESYNSDLTSGQKYVPKKKYNFRIIKIISYFMQYSPYLTEFYFVALIHEIGKGTQLYNGNINKPDVGYFATILFSLFYLGRIAGNFFALLFSYYDKHIEITYYMGLPMCVVIFIMGFFKKGWWITVCRTMLGFCSAYAPVMCILRSKCDILDAYLQKREFKKRGQSEKSPVVVEINSLAGRVLEYSFTFIPMIICALLYNLEKRSIWRPSLVMGIIMSALYGWFFFVFECREPQYLPDRKNTLHTQNEIKREKANRLKATRLFGRIGRMFSFFFDDEALMYQTFAVKLYDAVRMVDFVFMIIMVQTNPYTKGLFLPRIPVILWVAAANLIAHILVYFLIERIVTHENALSYMKTTALISILAYPILNTCVNIFNYQAGKIWGGRTWIYICYFLSEVIKFALLYIMEEGLHEVINKSSRKKKFDKFKALGHCSDDFFKFLVFSIFGYFITRLMASYRVQKRNPFNYTIGFLILCLPLLISYLMLLKGVYEEQGHSENDSRNNERQNNPPAVQNGGFGGQGGSNPQPGNSGGQGFDSGNNAGQSTGPQFGNSGGQGGDQGGDGGFGGGQPGENANAQNPFDSNAGNGGDGDYPGVAA